jgi:hypothetical protein
MNKSDYQVLRWSVECHIADSIYDPILVRELTNRIMRQFVSTMAASQVKQAAGNRAFRTFRRDKQVTPPSWAFRKPGTDSRLPKL